MKKNIIINSTRVWNVYTRKSSSGKIPFTGAKPHTVIRRSFKHTKGFLNSSCEFKNEVVLSIKYSSNLFSISQCESKRLQVTLVPLGVSAHLRSLGMLAKGIVWDWADTTTQTRVEKSRGPCDNVDVSRENDCWQKKKRFLLTLM